MIRVSIIRDVIIASVLIALEPPRHLFRVVCKVDENREYDENQNIATHFILK